MLRHLGFNVVRISVPTLVALTFLIIFALMLIQHVLDVLELLYDFLLAIFVILVSLKTVVVVRAGLDLLTTAQDLAELVVLFFDQVLLIIDTLEHLCKFLRILVFIVIIIILDDVLLFDYLVIHLIRLLHVFFFHLLLRTFSLASHELLLERSHAVFVKAELLARLENLWKDFVEVDLTHVIVALVFITLTLDGVLKLLSLLLVHDNLLVVFVLISSIILLHRLLMLLFHHIFFTFALDAELLREIRHVVTLTIEIAQFIVYFHLAVQV